MCPNPFKCKYIYIYIIHIYIYIADVYITCIQTNKIL